MKNQANAWTAKDCPLFDKCRYADGCPWKTTDGRIVCASGMYEIPAPAPQTDPDVELLYPVDVSMPDGSIMTIADRETHLKALRAWGCHSELFTAVTREEAERIASEELAEIAAQTDRGIELTRSWVRFFPSMNHRGGRQMQGFFYATREAAGIGGNFPNGGTRTLRERLSEALANAEFLDDEIETMLNNPEKPGYCMEAIDAARKRRMKARPTPADAASAVPASPPKKNKGGRPPKNSGGITQKTAAEIYGCSIATIRALDRGEKTTDPRYPGRKDAHAFEEWATTMLYKGQKTEAAKKIGKEALKARKQAKETKGNMKNAVPLHEDTDRVSETESAWG